MCSAAHVLMIVLAKRRRVPCEQPVSIFALHDVSENCGRVIGFCLHTAATK